MDLAANPPRRRRGAELEEALLDAAWDQLVEGGYAAFTIEAVAERAQTSRPVIYRRWPDRQALVRATMAHGLRQGQVEVPDTGSLREDVVELLRRANVARTPIIPVVSVLLGAYFADTGQAFADIRREMLGDRRRTAMDDIVDRAIARGEVDAARMTPRVRALPFDLFRHQLLMTLRPAPDAEIEAIVDEIFLPLAMGPAR